MLNTVVAIASVLSTGKDVLTMKSKCVLIQQFFVGHDGQWLIETHMAELITEVWRLGPNSVLGFDQQHLVWILLGGNRDLCVGYMDGCWGNQLVLQCSRTPTWWFMLMTLRDWLEVLHQYIRVW